MEVLLVYVIVGAGSIVQLSTPSMLCFRKTCFISVPASAILTIAVAEVCPVIRH